MQVSSYGELAPRAKHNAAASRTAQAVLFRSGRGLLEALPSAARKNCYSGATPCKNLHPDSLRGLSENPFAANLPNVFERRLLRVFVFVISPKRIFSAPQILLGE